MNLNELYSTDTQHLCNIEIALRSFSEWFQKRYDQFLQFLASDENISMSVPFVSNDVEGNIINKVILLSKDEFDNILNRDENYVFDLPCADGSVFSTDSVTVDTLVDSVLECGKSAAINSGLFQYLSSIGSRERVNITDLISTIKTKVNIPENDPAISDLTSLITGSDMTKSAFLSTYFQNTQNSFNPDEFIFNVDQYQEFSLVSGIFIDIALDYAVISSNIFKGFKTILNGLESIVGAIKDGFSWIMNHINPGLLMDYEINEKENGGIIDIPIYHTVLPIDDTMDLLFNVGNDWYTWDPLGNNYHYRVDFGPGYDYRSLFSALINSETKYLEIIRSFHIIRLIYLPDDESIDIQIYLTNQGCDQYGQYYSVLPADESNESVLSWIYGLMNKAEYQIYKYPCSPYAVPIGTLPDPFWLEHGSNHLFYEGTGFTQDSSANKPIDLIMDLTFIRNQSFLNNPYSNILASTLLRYTLFQYLLSSDIVNTTGRLYVDNSLYQTFLTNSQGSDSQNSFFPYNKVPSLPTLCHCQTNIEMVNEWKTFLYKAIITAAIVTSTVIISKVISKIKNKSYLKKLQANQMANAYVKGEISYEEFAPYLKKARKYQKIGDIFAPTTSLFNGVDSNEIDTQLRRDIKSVGVLIKPTF